MDSPQSPYQPPQAPSSKVTNRPRRPWLAALLSLFFVGLGQLYAGRLARAVAWLAFYVAAGMAPFIVLASSGMMEDRPGLLWAMIMPAVALWFLNGTDAFLVARRNRKEFTPKWFNHPAVYVLFPLLSVLILHLTAHGCKAVFFESFIVPTAGMSPTILPGDRIIANKLAYRKAMPRRGDICIYRLPDEGVCYVMRVIALPGDEIEIRDGRPVVNCTVVPREPAKIDPEIEAYLRERGAEGPFDNLAAFRETLGGRSYDVFDSEAYAENQLPWMYEDLRTFAATTVPRDNIFVLGDNRTMSKDSRILGFVHARDIIGRMESRYWRSFDADAQRPHQ